MKKFGSTIQILSLGCACLIGVGSRLNRVLQPRRLIQAICSFTGPQSLAIASTLRCQLMGRTWQALPRAKPTMATCRQASTSLSLKLLPAAPECVRDNKR